MSYRVTLDVFEGPFDLLLQLISKKKVDIYEVDLAQLTGDFLAHLAELVEIDLDSATHFLVVAATLIELKAVRLLPKDERDELEDLLGEARDMLYARLLEYRAFRDASRTLGALLGANEDFHGREVRLEPRYRRLVPDTPLTVDPAGLAGLAAAALAPKPEPHLDLSHVKLPYLTIRDAALQVLGRLPRVGAATEFRRLVAGRTRGDQVAVFLAILELYKLGHLQLEQPESFGPMQVARTREGVPVGISMLGADFDAPAEPAQDPDQDPAQNLDEDLLDEPSAAPADAAADRAQLAAEDR